MMYLEFLDSFYQDSGSLEYGYAYVTIWVIDPAAISNVTAMAVALFSTSNDDMQAHCATLGV